LEKQKVESNVQEDAAKIEVQKNYHFYKYVDSGSTFLVGVLLFDRRSTF
jgi:hypothetical protein